MMFPVMVVSMIKIRHNSLSYNKTTHTAWDRLLHTQPQRRAKDGPLSAMLTIVDKYPHSNRLRTKVSCFSAGSIHANTIRLQYRT